jgi:hypothetical protein
VVRVTEEAIFYFRNKVPIDRIGDSYLIQPQPYNDGKAWLGLTGRCTRVLLRAMRVSGISLDRRNHQRT